MQFTMLHCRMVQTRSGKAKSETHCTAVAAVAIGCVGLSVVNRRKGLSPTFWLRSGPVPPLQILLELPWRSEAIPTRGRRPLLNEWSNTFPSWLIQTRVPLQVTRCYLAVMTGSHSAGTMERQIYKSFAKGRVPSLGKGWSLLATSSSVPISTSESTSDKPIVYCW